MPASSGLARCAPVRLANSNRRRRLYLRRLPFDGRHRSVRLPGRACKEVSPRAHRIRGVDPRCLRTQDTLPNGAHSRLGRYRSPFPADANASMKRAPPRPDPECFQKKEIRSDRISLSIESPARAQQCLGVQEGYRTDPELQSLLLWLKAPQTVSVVRRV